MQNVLAKIGMVIMFSSMATVATANNQVVNQSALTQSVTVQQALNLADKSKVQIKGNVIKNLGNEKYQFRDQTGTIMVEIDDELWQNKAVSSSQIVTLIGEIDIDLKPTKHVTIDVDQVKF